MNGRDPYTEFGVGPGGKDYIAFEPMTAPTSALTTGRGLRLVPADESFRASFRVRFEALV
jgi:aldose 1-epimerase